MIAFSTISRSTFDSLGETQRVIAHDYSRRFAAFEFGGRTWGVSWRSDVIEPEVLEVGDRVFVAVDEQLACVSSAGVVLFSRSLPSVVLQLIDVEGTLAVLCDVVVLFVSAEGRVLDQIDCPTLPVSVVSTRDGTRVVFEDGSSAPWRTTPPLKDLSDPLSLALAKASGWSAEMALQALHQVAPTVTSPRVDWDSGVPEQWARLFGSHLTIAVSTAVPFAFVDAHASASVLAAATRAGLVTAPFDTWDGVEFCARTAVLDRVFGRVEWRPTMRPEAFSASDLWYLTICRTE